MKPSVKFTMKRMVAKGKALLMRSALYWVFEGKELPPLTSWYFFILSKKMFTRSVFPAFTSP